MKNVLIIDDEQACLTTTTFVLSSSGYNIFTAESGAKGLACLKEQNQRYDLIILDLMMPDIYGLDVLKEIRNDINTKHIPVILHTGSANENEIEEAKSLGAEYCVRKPYKRTTLLNIVEEALS